MALPLRISLTLGNEINDLAFKDLKADTEVFELFDFRPGSKSPLSIL